MPQAPAPPIAPPAGAPCQTPASQHPARSAQRYASLQMLRAVAAYAVLLFHLGLFRLGYAGVDVFFVLSGFIMGMLGTQEGARAFLLRRLIRIAPLYWAVTLAFCAITAVPGMARHFVLHGADLLRSLLFVPYVNAQGEIWPIVVPGWTLDYEILFYALMGLCLAGCRRAAPQVLVAVLLALVAAGALLQPAAAPAQVLTGPLLLEFLFGLLLCASRPLWGRWEGLVALVLGLAAFAFWAARGEADFTGFHRIATLGLASALLVGGAIGLEQGGAGTAWRPLALLGRAAERMGDASYSLYLLHPLALPFVEKLLHGQPLLRPVVALALSSAVALAAFRWFERPVGKALRRALRA